MPAQDLEEEKKPETKDEPIIRDTPYDPNLKNE